jgi:hypothetical protein
MKRDRVKKAKKHNRMKDKGNKNGVKVLGERKENVSKYNESEMKTVMDDTDGKRSTRGQ